MRIDINSERSGSGIVPRPLTRMVDVMYLAMISLTFALSGVSINAQVAPLYKQMIASNSGTSGYGIKEIGSINNEGSLLVFSRLRGLSTISMSALTVDSVEAPSGIHLYSDADFQRMNGGVFGYLRSQDGIAFSFDLSTGFQIVDVPFSTSKLDISEAGPIVASYAGYSIDGGRTWIRDTDITTSFFQYSPRGTAIVGSQANMNKRFMLVRDRGPQKYAVGLTSEVHCVVVRRYGTDSIAAIGDRGGLWLCALGDSTSVLRDTMPVDGVRTALCPKFIETLADGSLLYADARGWCGRMRDGRISKLADVPFSSYLMQIQEPTDSVVLWFTTTVDSFLIYKVTLHTDPTIERYTLPFDFVGTKNFAHNGIIPSCLGTYGVCLGWHGPQEYLVDLHGDRADVVMTGSLFTKGYEYMDVMSMLYAWRGSDSTLHVIDEKSNGISVDTRKIGHCVQPFMTLDYRELEYRRPSSFLRYLGWRETGVPMPCVRDSAMLLPGPVLRRFDMNGALLDTVLRSPTSFISSINDSVFVSGWGGTIRVHGRAGFATSTTDVASQHGCVVMGHPSSATAAADGTLFTSVLGTCRLEPDHIEVAPHRWGGMLRSTDKGISWSEVVLPDTTSSYVMKVFTTSASTLLATVMTMVEDTSVCISQNTVEYEYRASNAQILRSTDHGRTWSVVCTPFFSGLYRFTSGTIIEPTTGVLLASTIAGMQLSTDDGRTWSSYDELPGTAHPVSMTLEDDEILVATTLGVYRIDKTLSAPADDGGRERTTELHILTRRDLQLLAYSTGTCTASITDVDGRTMDLRTFIAAPSFVDGIYVIDLGGTPQDRAVVCVTD